MAKLTPQTIEFADTAPVQAEGSGVVAGTPAEVWAVLLDYPAWPKWFRGVKTCRSTSDPATGVGSTREVALQGGARVEERFIAWEDERLWSFTGTAVTPISPFRSLVERVMIEELEPGRTRVTYRMALDPKPLLKPLATVLVKGINANLAKAMTALDREVRRRR